MKLAYLALIFVFAGLPPASGKETADRRADRCEWIPELRSLRDTCQGEDPADVCGWIGAVQAFYDGDEAGAAGHLVRAFGVPEDLAPRLLAAFANFYLVAVDEASCSPGELKAIVLRSQKLRPLDETRRRQDNVFLPLLLRLLRYEPSAIERMMANNGRGGGPEIARASEAFMVFLERTSNLPRIQDAVAKKFELEGACAHCGIGSEAAGRAPSADPLARIDEALALLRAGDLEAAESAFAIWLAAASPADRGWGLARAGIGFFQQLRYEEALRLLEKAHSWLAAAGEQDGASRQAQTIVEAAQKAIGKYLKVPIAQGQQARDALPIDPDVLFSNDPRVAQTAAVRLLEDVAAGRISIAELEDFEAAVRRLFPRPPSLPGSQVPPQMESGRPDPEKGWYVEITENLVLGRHAEAYRAWKKAYAARPHLSKLIGLALLMKDADGRGDVEATYALSSEGVDLWGKHLEQMRTEDVPSILGDRTGSHLYLAAVFSAARTGRGAEALALAERGRAFTLRRWLGFGEGRLPGSLDPREKELDRQIRRLERQPAGSRTGLAELYGEFSAARMMRNLRSRPKGSAILPPSPDIRQLHRELRPKETLLVYYPGLEGHVLVWRLGPGEDFLIPLREPAAGRIACLAQALRWRRTPEAARRRAAERGVAVLLDCPETKPEDDPAALLYAALLAPAELKLEPGARLLIVPHGELHAVPFAALRDETGQLLADKYELAIEPSADALGRIRRRLEQVQS